MGKKSLGIAALALIAILIVMWRQVDTDVSAPAPEAKPVQVAQAPVQHLTPITIPSSPDVVEAPAPPVEEKKDDGGKYDPQSDEYTWYWVDSMGMPSSVSRGRWLGDTLTFESAHPGGGGGRYVYRWEGNDKHHFKIENTFDGGQTWNPFMEATYLRKA